MVGIFFSPFVSANISSPVGCQSLEPVVDVTLAVRPQNAGNSAVYLPKSTENRDLFPGIKLNFSWLQTSESELVFSPYFDFDDELLSTDYSLYRLQFIVMSGNKVLK